MKTQVAIIGAGPTGLTLANLLARRGVSVVVVEKRAKPYGLPRAVHFDGEAMRVFQAAGLAGEMVATTHVGKGMLFKDTDDVVLVDWSRSQEIGAMGWHESYRCHQPVVENVLREGLGRFDCASLIEGAAVNSVSQDSDGVVVALADGRRIEANYCVGCDGAKSFLRSVLGLTITDFGFAQHWLVVDVELTRARPDLGDFSVQFCDPNSSATYVRSIGNRRRWEFRLDGDVSLPDDDAIWERLARWITREDARLERAVVYEFRSMLADEWHLGRCFLAGDSAHQMPPFMGQGMCAGIRDAHNLAWKLAQALQGGEDVLASYTTERRTNVQQFIDLTMQLGRLITQTAEGAAPDSVMESIWPALGAGLGMRDGLCGTLAPQVRVGSDLADNVAGQGFYVLSAAPREADFPVVVGAQDWLADKGVAAVLVRPDGYILESYRA